MEENHMSMGRRPTEQQPDLWIPTADLPHSPGHVFYDKLNRLLAEAAFDLARVNRLLARYASRRSGSSTRRR